jgi:MtrB/PioB family decaheme-associated outer membrane protein
MRPNDSRHKLLALALGALLLGFAPLAAQEEEETARGFTFRIDPIVLGVLDTDVDTDSAKFEEYEDWNRGFNIPLLRIVGETPDGERTFRFRGEDLGERDARYTLDYGVVGRYGITLDYNKIVHRFGNKGRLIHTEVAPGVFLLPDPLQAQIQGAIESVPRGQVNFGFLNNLLQPYLATASFEDLALQRDRFSAVIELGRMANLGWGLELQHENRTGDRAWGASFGFNNLVELPEPIDYDTSQAELAGEWNGANGGARFGARYNKFENNVSTLIWDNPFRAVSSTDPTAYLSPGGASTGGSMVGFADLAPDNEATTLFVDGRTRFGGNWWAHGSASYILMTQDDPLLPYTLNAAITGVGFGEESFDPTDPANLPQRSADREAVVTNLAAETGTRFAESFGLTFRYRLYDYENDSDAIRFPGYVRYHAVWEEIPRITALYGYTRQTLGTELTWDLTQATRLSLAYDLKTWEREFREVEDSDEDVIKLAVDSRPLDGLTVRASYELGDRTIDRYDPEAQEFSFLHPEGVNNQLGLRKFAQAAREYDAINASAQYFFAEAWNVFVGVTSLDEDYDESALGLLTNESLQYNAELAYTPGENLTFYVFAQRVDTESFQRARQSGGTLSTNPLDDWTATLTGDFTLLGLGLETRRGPWTINASTRWSENDGDADLFSPPGGTPDIAIGFDTYDDYELFAVWTGLQYQISPRASAGFSYRYEDYTLDSFLTNGLRNYMPGALLLNAENGDYEASIFGINLNLAF